MRASLALRKGIDLCGTVADLIDVHAITKVLGCRPRSYDLPPWSDRESRTGGAFTMC
jgi:hypothetical protein